MYKRKNYAGCAFKYERIKKLIFLVLKEKYCVKKKMRHDDTSNLILYSETIKVTIKLK